MTEHRYLHLLPQSTIRDLYGIHPLLPILAIDALLGILLYVLVVSVAGTTQIRSRTRSRDLGTVTRIRRAFRDLY